ncbi:MAG: hypothetical protein WC640_01255 [Candidatus Paceibacterota bacterium]|jgi:hypothetical protein
MPAYSKAEILRSSREREKKIKNTKRILGLLLVVFIVGGFLLLLNLNFFRLTAFNVSGQTSQDLSVLKGVIRENLNGYYLGLVPNNSVFFFSKKNLAVLLRQKFPGLQSVGVDSPNLNTLNISLIDRESKVLWCNQLVSGKRCFYLNDDGLAYQEAPNFSDAIIMEFESRGIVKELPSSVINPQDLSRAKLFLSFLKSSLADWSLSAGSTSSLQASSGQAISSSAYKLARINVLPFKDFEAIIVSNASPDNSWRLLFNTGTASDQLITNFHSLIKDPTLTKDWVGKNLDYLDMRFDNKVFYRFK